MVKIVRSIWQWITGTASRAAPKHGMKYSIKIHGKAAVSGAAGGTVIVGIDEAVKAGRKSTTKEYVVLRTRGQTGLPPHNSLQHHRSNSSGVTQYCILLYS